MRETVVLTIAVLSIVALVFLLFEYQIDQLKTELRNVKAENKLLVSRDHDILSILGPEFGMLHQKIAQLTKQ